MELRTRAQFKRQDTSGPWAEAFYRRRSAAPVWPKAPIPVAGCCTRPGTRPGRACSANVCLRDLAQRGRKGGALDGADTAEDEPVILDD